MKTHKCQVYQEIQQCNAEPQQTETHLTHHTQKAWYHMYHTQQTADISSNIIKQQKTTNHIKSKTIHFRFFRTPFSESRTFLKLVPWFALLLFAISPFLLSDYVRMFFSSKNFNFSRDTSPSSSRNPSNSFEHQRSADRLERQAITGRQLLPLHSYWHNGNREPFTHPITLLHSSSRADWDRWPLTQKSLVSLEDGRVWHHLGTGIRPEDRGITKHQHQN